MFPLVLFAALFRSKKGTGADSALGEPSDRDLMLRYADGDVDAFELLVERHERGVFNFVYRSLRNPARAEEVTQEVFLRVIKNRTRYRPNAKFTTWLYTIARNLCIDEARKRSIRHNVSLDNEVGDDAGGTTHLDLVADHRAKSGTGDIARAEFRQRLQEGLDALPGDQREVFLLRQYEGLKFREIADVVGVSENTVKSRMRYALETLRGYLDEFKGASLDGLDKDETGDAPDHL